MKTEQTYQANNLEILAKPKHNTYYDHDNETTEHKKIPQACFTPYLKVQSMFPVSFRQNKELLGGMVMTKMDLVI